MRVNWRQVFATALAVLIAPSHVSAQLSLSEKISLSIRDRVAQSSNHAVINKNAEVKAQATAPKPQPKKRATYAAQKKQAHKLRNKPKRN